MNTQASNPLAKADSPAGPAAPKKKKTAGVRADELMAEAGRKVLRFHFERMLVNEAGTREGRDIEALHDMRVATRRQRAAFRLFAPYFRSKVTRPFRQGLRELAQRLGAVRDWDVLIEAAQAYPAGLEAKAQALQPLVSAWGQQREQARADLLGYLDNPDYETFKQDYAEFLASAVVEVDPAPAGLPQPRLVQHALPARVWDHYGAVRAYEAIVSSASLEALHALRIQAKRLRYALEFFREALPSEAREAIAALVALQDHLGDLHDTDVTIGLLHEFRMREERPPFAPEVAKAVGQYLKFKQARLRQLRRSLKRPWRAVMSKKFRQLLGRSVAEL